MVHRSNPLPPLDERPVVAIYRSPLFNASESFVQAHAAGLTRYQPLLVGLEDKGNARPELHDRLVTAASAGEATAFRLLGTAGLAERLRPAAPRLVHAHFATDGLLALPLARALGVPLVTTFHGYDIGRSRLAMLASGRLSWMRYALLRRRLIERGDLFLAVSDAVRTAALAQGYPADRTRTHYLGVDLSHFAGAATPEPGLVLHVGRLVEKKGTAVLIAAMERLPEARLIVIGDGPLRGALERQGAALGGRVRFLGALPSDEVAGWMSRAWLLAAPSVTARDGDAEGLPTVIAEAAAAALPTVGTRHAGIPEAIVDGDTGFLAAERNAEGLAARIAELLGSRSLRDRMGEAARRLAAARFDGARQNAQLEDLYDGLLGQIRSWRRR
jgi:colanic acid/amylovoran biosynthesis glycosyltransferase